MAALDGLNRDLDLAPRTWEAWLLLVAILIVCAMPALICWLLC